MSERRSSRIAALGATADAARARARASLEVDPEEVLPQLERTRARSHAAAVAVVSEVTQELQTIKTRQPGRQPPHRQTRSTAKRRKMHMLPNYSPVQRRHKRSASATTADASATDASTPYDASPAKIPTWDNEPMLDCWSFILYYASANEKGVIDMTWLLKTATVCKSFAYGVDQIIWSHPRVSNARAGNRLISALSIRDSSPEDPSPQIPYLDQKDRIIRRLAMARSLSIGPMQIQSARIWTWLLNSFPRVTEIDITFPIHPELRNRCSYPPDLYYSLTERVTDARTTVRQLETWRWNLKILDQSFFHCWDKLPSPYAVGIEIALRMHSQGPLRELTTLHLEDIPTSWVQHDNGGRAEEPCTEKLSLLVSTLKNLHTLTLTNCNTSLDFIVGLPPQLQHISLDRVYIHVTDDQFSPDESIYNYTPLERYIVKSGHLLRSLRLSETFAAGTLGILNRIAEHCPYFEELYADLASDDDHRLLSKDWLQYFPIAWPKGLQILELCIRGIDMETIEHLLSDLVASADKLPHLRRLSLRITMESHWRARASFRERWHTVLDHVFKRRVTPPLPYSSLSQYKALFGRSCIPENSACVDKEQESRPTLSGFTPSDKNKSTCSADPGFESDSTLSSIHSDSECELSADDSETPESRCLREMTERIRKNLKLDDLKKYHSHRNSDLTSKPPRDLYGRLDVLPTPRQVHKLDFVVDNMKPAPVIFGMADFLDLPAADSMDSEYEDMSDDDRFDFDYSTQTI
ncbi:hypothetical protein BROUX41_004281 [Berkeleyomyces rouxiae]|uniref:uncharacterized protein n=1 Tax=Berkeleyomyces rouxiae TaxID=2035830 RepID=UPI003B7F2DD3